MRFWIGSCLALSALCLGGCAAEPEELPAAREVTGAGSFEQAARDRRQAAGGPRVPRLKPKTVRAFPEKKIKPAWKGPTHRALELHPEVAAEVDATRARSVTSVEGRDAAARRAARRRRAATRARIEAAKRLDGWLDTETKRRAKKLATELAKWKKLRPKRIAWYLAEARRLAGGEKARAVDLVRESEALSKVAARRALASEELRDEAATKAARARRFAKVTYVEGLRLPEASAEAEHAERRLTEITLIAAYSQLEAKWAKQAYRKSVATWERFLAKTSD